jgi:hypothetical protein
MPRIAFIDLEASGLGSASFPTEIGWAILREDGSVNPDACLIRPPSKWTRYANAWNPASERITGITRAMLDRDGLYPSEALTRFLEAVGERDLFSDEPQFDSHWLNMLAEAAAISLAGRSLGDAKKLIQLGAKHGLTIKFDETPRHRAEPDARRLALAVSRAITLVQPIGIGDETHTENPTRTPP